jgi:hypothetical protein
VVVSIIIDGGKNMSEPPVMDLEHLLNVGKVMKSQDPVDAELSDLDTIRRSGFVYVGPNELFSDAFCAHQAQTLMAGQEAFAQKLPKSANFGIVAVEARGKAKGGFVYASATITKDALVLDSMVVDQDLRPLYPEEVQDRVVQIPSAFYVEPPPKNVKNTQWRFVHGPDNARLANGFVPVAIVALTPVQITFIPHSEVEMEAWEALTFGGGHDSTRKHARPTTSMSGEFSKKLNTDSPSFTLTATMGPGSRFITHRGMPIFLSHAAGHTPDEPFVVKTVAVEMRDEQEVKTRHNQWRRALAERGWKRGTFGDNMCYKLAGTKSMDNHTLIYPAIDYETMVSVEEIKALIVSPKGKLPPDPAKKAVKKKAVAAAPSVDQKVGLVFSPVGSISPKKKQVRIAVTVEKEEKEEKVVKKKRVDPTVALFAEHDALMARVSNIAPGAWDKGFSVKSDAHRAYLEAAEDSTLPEVKTRIKKFRTSLKTLASKVEQGETDAKETLPGVLETLQECTDLLGALNIPQDATKLLKSYTSGIAELSALKSSYIMRSAKRLDTFVSKCHKLRDSAHARAEKRKVKEPFMIPVVDEDALETDMCRGADAITVIYKQWSARGDTFGNMTTALKFDHPEVGMLFSRYEAILEQVWDYSVECEFIPDGEVEYDIGKLNAYGTALQYVFDAVGSGRPIGSATKKGKKMLKQGSTAGGGGGIKIECQLCTYKRPEFNGCGCCKQCFKENHLPRKMEELENRSAYLEKLADKETKALVSAYNKLRSTVKDPSVLEEPEIGPYQAAWDAWNEGVETDEGIITDGLYEKLVKEGTRFVRNNRANNWEALEELIKEADIMLPHLRDEDYSPPHESSSDIDDFVVPDDDEEEEEEEEDDGAQKPMDIEDEEEEEEDEAPLHKSPVKRKRVTPNGAVAAAAPSGGGGGGGGGGGTADAVIMALKKYRFSDTHKVLLDMYPDNLKGVHAELERVSTITEAYAIDMKFGNEEGWTYEWYFRDSRSAMVKMKDLKLDGLSLMLRKVDISPPIERE